MRRLIYFTDQHFTQFKLHAALTNHDLATVAVECPLNSPNNQAYEEDSITFSILNYSRPPHLTQ